MWVYFGEKGDEHLIIWIVYLFARKEFSISGDGVTLSRICLHLSTTLTPEATDGIGEGVLFFKKSASGTSFVFLQITVCTLLFNAEMLMMDEAKVNWREEVCRKLFVWMEDYVEWI